MKSVALTVMLLVGSGWAQNYDPMYFQTNSDIRFLVPDKAQHFYGSQLLASQIGPVPAFVAGVLWEIGEAQLGGFISWRDLGADALGVIASQLRVGAMYVTWDVERKEVLLRLGVVL